jgi:hypothetical protein
MLLAIFIICILSCFLLSLSFSTKRKRLFKILSMAFALPVMLMLKTLEPLVVDKMDMGPCTTTFGGTYLGRTKGETQFNYSIDTYKVETEEDGPVDEVVTADTLTVTIPLIYTDIDTLALTIPWAKKITANGETKLEIGKAIGQRLFQYAKELSIHPASMPDDDKSKDLTVYKCYPKPGPLNFTYSRQGDRIANIQFIAVRDGSKAVGQDYFCVGDPAIAAW